MPMISQRDNVRGFTLMEITTVIIVIAVLASIGGQSLVDMIDDARRSACKSQFNAIKSAILKYKADVGFFPFIGGYEGTTNDELLSDDSANNALVYDGAANSVIWGGISRAYNIPNPAKYKSKWNGPYMDSDAENFMIDPWGRKIKIAFHYRKAYLHSAGPDGQFDTFWDAALDRPSDLTTLEYSGDDVVFLVASKLDVPP